MQRIILIYLISRLLFMVVSNATEKNTTILETQSMPPEKRMKLELKVYRGRILTKVVYFGGGLYLLLEIIRTILSGI